MNQIFRLMLIGACLLFFTLNAFAEAPKSGRISFNKPAITTARTLSNIGNWAYWMYDDGQSGIEPDGTSGGFYPRGTSAVIFEDGFVWGGFLTDAETGLPPEQPMRVGGQTYRIGTQAGPIIEGVPDDPGNNRIYRIRSDWATLTFGQVAQELAEAYQIEINATTQTQADDMIEQYRIDWNEWPTDKGAPYVDADSNGTYDPVLDGDGNVSLDGDYPGIALADQVVYTVVNDLNAALTADMYGSQPIGLELQITAWAYNQPGAGLGQLIFKKYKLINKGRYNIDSMYVAQWCDPDVGNAGNDLVGCDTILSLGYAYNGEAQDVDYQDFELSPSAGGYDFFQGPLVEGVAGQDLNKNGVDDAEDYAIFGLQRVGPGYINLPMTSFGYFAAGSPFGEDPELGEYKGSKEWYNLLRGFGTISDDIINPTPFTAGSGVNAGQVTKYPMSGDPVGDPTGALGDIDGQGNNPTPADRRMCLATGPFDLPVWDDANGNGIPDFGDAGVQEVVVAIVGGNSGPSSSGNALLSVAQMKNNDIVAQKLFDDLFQSVPKAPPSPVVKAITYEKSITLEWGSDPNTVAATEADNPVTGYNFQGYNVYQMPNATSSKDESVLLATFDIIDGVTTIWGNRFDPVKGMVVPVALELGKDLGLKRHFTIKADAITGTQLYPGNTYYFSVTAYNYNAAPTLIEDKTLESTLLATVVIPQSTEPGVRYGGNSNDLVDVTQTEGASDGEVQVTIIDPEALTGDSYEVFFEEFQYITLDPHTTVTIDSVDTLINLSTGDTIIVVVDSTVTTIVDSLINTAVGWNVRNTTTGELMVENQFQAASLDEFSDQPIFEGVQVKVSGPPLTAKDWDWEDGEVSPLYPDYDDGRCISGEDWGGNALFGGLGMAHIFWGEDPGVAPADFVTVEFRFTHMTSFDDTSGDGEYTFGSGGGEPYYFNVEEGQKAFMYQTWATGSANFVGFHDIPFQVWDVDDPNNPRQLNVVIRDRDTNTRWDLGTGDGPYNYVWVMADDYDPTGQAWDPANGADHDFMNLLLSGPVPAYYVLWGIQRGSRQFLAESGILTLYPNKVNTVADKFTFDAPTPPLFSAEVAKSDVDKINVYPNPYYGKNSEEIGRFANFVIFNHLPVNQEVTIRIFALNGVQVRKLEKHADPAANEDQFFRWDLNNEAGLPVASGIYIAHIDMPDLGKTKVLKLFIVQSAEILQYF
jgi:hypothetical protein